MTTSTTKQRSDAYAATHKQAWLKQFFPNKNYGLRDWGNISLFTSPLFFFLGLFFVPCLIIAIGLVAFSAISHVFDPVAHAPKDELALTMPNESLISSRLPSTFKVFVQPQRANELYTGHLYARDYHAFDALHQGSQLHGDRLKAKFLSDFAKELDDCKDLPTLQETVHRQIYSDKYVTRATVQGILTRFFGLKTTSQEKYEEMCKTKASGFYASMATI